MPRLKAALLLGRTATGARMAATADMVIGGGGGRAGAARWGGVWRRAGFRSRSPQNDCHETRLATSTKLKQDSIDQ